MLAFTRSLRSLRSGELMAPPSAALRLRDGKAALRRTCGGDPRTPRGCAVVNVTLRLDGIGD